jgi:hypothetical protein
MNLNDLFGEAKIRPGSSLEEAIGDNDLHPDYHQHGDHPPPRLNISLFNPNKPNPPVPFVARPMPNQARDIATGRNVGGNAIPSLGQSGKVVTNKTVDNALTKLGGKSTEVTPGPKVTSGSTKVELDPFVDVPTYIRQNKPDPVTVPKPGTKPRIKVQSGETLDQAIQRTRAEQEFSNFLKGQGSQTFGDPGSGRGGQGGPTAAQATSGFDQAATAKKIQQDMWNRMQTGQEKEAMRKEIEAKQRRDAWKNPDTDVELEETHKKSEVDYDDEYDAMVARVKKLAGLGPMKTVYDPAKRQYRNMPTAVQPKVQPKK